MLEKLFTSKNRVKVIGFLFFIKKETYLREISNELKISVSAVKREIDNLEFIGIVKKEGRKIKLDSKNNILDDLKNIFIKTDYVVYPIKDALKNINAKFIFIFGSFARNDFNEESDIDLMVIGEISLGKVIKILSLVEKTIEKDINPVVWTLENLKKEKNSSFVKDISKKGIMMIRGMKMNFNKLLSEKKIEDVEKKEFKADLIQKSLEFAEKGLETENYDDVMAMTYNIIFKISNRLINSLGYRAIGKEHHKNLFEFLKEAVPGDLVEYFDKIRIKRNNFIYRDIEIVSKEEAEEIRTFVQEIRTGGENE